MTNPVHYPHIHVGVSRCLLGEHVRYDGGHKLNPTVTTVLVRYFTLVDYCPEVAIGMGVPRPPMQLVSIDKHIHARGVEDPRQDRTAELTKYGRSIALEIKNLSGYIFKARSPSCGLTDTPLFNEHKRLIGQTQGLFAAQIGLHHPELPVIDETELATPEYCVRFIQDVLDYANSDKRTTV